MTTLWMRPTTFSQFSQAEEHDVAWNEQPLSLPLRSNGVLHHIARSPKHDIKNKTWTIKATGFQFADVPNTITGVEVKITAKRGGRARDDAVTLCYEDEVIGENKASKEVLPQITYGGSGDTWSAKVLTKEMIEDPSFGIMIRFRAHPEWPHRTYVQIDSVEMRIH